MLERISNGWKMARASWQVLQMDQELLLFPLASGIASFCLLLGVALPGWVFQDVLLADQILDDSFREIVFAICGMSFYLINNLIVFYFNSALIACALIRFRGGDPQFTDGLYAANRRLGSILAWTLFSATVGWILRLVSQRVGLVGQIITGLLGATWTVATYFVVPVLVIEGVGPISAVRRSTEIITKTWGEAAVGRLSLGLVNFCLLIPGILVFVGAGFALQQPGYVPLAVGCAVSGFVLLVLGVLTGSALQGIFSAALFQYATSGETPTGFDRHLFREAFGRR